MGGVFINIRYTIILKTTHTIKKQQHQRAMFIQSCQDFTTGLISGILLQAHKLFTDTQNICDASISGSLC